MRNPPIFYLEHKEKWKPIVEEWREDGYKIVTTNGAFDILHVGHIHLLSEAKAQGDVLIVGLNSDASIKSYKSKLRPIVPEEERAKMLQSLRFVDMVILFHQPDCLDFVASMKPHVHVKDATYGHNLLEGPIVIQGGGRIHLVQKDDHSTTNIIEKIRTIYA